MIWQKHTIICWEYTALHNLNISKRALWGKPTSCMIHFNINIFIAIICKIKICKCLQDEICSNKFVSQTLNVWDVQLVGCVIFEAHVQSSDTDVFGCCWRTGEAKISSVTASFFLSVTENHLVCQQRIRLADRLTVTATRINSANQWQLTRSEPEQTQNRRDSIFFAPPPADLLNCLHLWPLMSVV